MKEKIIRWEKIGSGGYVEGKNSPEEKGTVKDKSTLHRKYAKWMLENNL